MRVVISPNRGIFSATMEPNTQRASHPLVVLWTEDDENDRIMIDVALSRSVLAERFTDLVGMPPMHYLAKWRMQIAAGLLSGGNSCNICAASA